MSVIDADAHVIETEYELRPRRLLQRYWGYPNTRARRQNQPIVGAKHFRR